MLRSNTTATGLPATLLLLVVVAVLLPGTSRAEPSTPLNVMVVTVDSLRPDHLGCYGYGRSTSPFIDRLAREGTLFRNAFTQGGWTSPAIVSLFTSYYPSVHGVEGRTDSFPCRQASPLSAWTAAGYRVPGWAAIENEANYANVGFQEDPDYMFTLEKLTAWIRKNRKTPFFCWYHINKTPHLPYQPKEPYRGQFLDAGGPPRTPEQEKRLQIVQEKVIIPRGSVPLAPEDRPSIEALYDGEVRMADDHVKAVYELLEAEGLLASTVLVVTADHGDELMDHGFVGHASTNWGGTLFDEIVHVPLIIRHPPDVPAGLVVEEIVELIDVLPSLHQLLDIPATPGLQGKSFLPLLHGNAAGWKNLAFSENCPCGYQCARVPDKAGIRLVSVRSLDWKLVATHTPEETRIDLYDLKADPYETRPSPHAESEIAAQYEELLLDWAYRNRMLRKRLLQACHGASGQ